MFSRIHEASRTNSEGVACLASGDALNAVKSFRAALSIMEEVAQCVESVELAHSQAHNCPSVEIALDDPVMFIYNRAIVLDGSCETDLAFANAVILFNLGLTFHQRGKLRNDASKLQKAVYLYGVSSKLITNTASSSGALVLAALNNQAQILFSLGDYVNAKDTLEQMRSIAHSVPVPTDDRKCNTFARYHFDEFFLNVAVTEPPHTAPMA